MYKCLKCDYEGKRKLKYKSSFLTEVGVWIVCIFLSLFIFGLPILIAVVFSVWRQASAKKVCPKCEGIMVKQN